MKKRNGYVPTSLDQFINESQTINLKRGYRGKPGITVGANAPVRDRILTFVSESKSVSVKELRTFIAGLNEGSKRPIASANMWMKRNMKFFVTENKNGTEIFKLSKVGKRLVNRFIAISEARDMNEMREDDHDFVDTKKGYARPGINDQDNMDYDDYDDEYASQSEDHWHETHETHESEIEDLVESKIDRLVSVLEKFKGTEEKIDKKPVLDEDDKDEEIDSDDELSFDDLDLGDDEDSEGEENLDDDELSLDDEGDDDVDEKVEISEFIITVDNAADAIAELKTLGVDAEAVEGTDDEMEGELEGGDEAGEDEDGGDEDGGDELGEEGDLGFGDEGEIEENAEIGFEDEGEIEENAEIGAGLSEDGESADLSSRVSTIEDKVKNLETNDISEADDDLEMELDEEAGEEELALGDEGEAAEDLEFGEGDEEGEVEDEDETKEYGTEEIRVPAEDFAALKGWLEDKGVDVDEVLGGEVEIEGEDEDLEITDAEEADVDSGDVDLGGDEEADAGDEEGDEEEANL